MSANAKERRRELWKILRRTPFEGRWLTTANVMAARGVYQLYEDFAYGGKDRLHDDLVKLTREEKMERTALAVRPTEWRAV